MSTTALVLGVAVIYFGLGVLIGVLWAGAGWRLRHPRPRPSEVRQPTCPEPHRPARGKF